MTEIETFDNWLNTDRLKHIEEDSVPSNIDSFGSKIGLTDKSSHEPTDIPINGPLGDIVKSAYAHINVPTRNVPGTETGSLGCAAAVSLIFYRATGYPMINNKTIELSTSNMWDYMNTSSDWVKISNWKSDSIPGDIILTRRGTKPGHVGVVVDDNKIVSNSSGGFEGDKKGQIEINYTLSGWNSVANRNPTKTASFRYKGKYKTEWDGSGTSRNNISNIGVESSTNIAQNGARNKGKYYYKVYDKANKRFLTAKYKGDMFKVYDRNMKLIGEVLLNGETIVMNNDDITNTPVGIVFKKLFVIAAKSGVISKTNSNDYITIEDNNVSTNIKLSPSDFMSKYGPSMISATEGTTLFPSVKLAQAALETGWGKSTISGANNMFGIKASGSHTKYWDGSKVSASTSEVYDGKEGTYTLDFRKYASLKDSILDHSNLLLTLSRYQIVRDATTPEEQAKALQSAGYATSGTYADVLISIINKYGFKDLDKQAGKTPNIVT